MKFRALAAEEIECRINTVKENGVTLLLYKDARCDMNILDETVGPENWQRIHGRDNANCTVSIWDSEKEQWISKEDTGTESYTDKEKGLASDSFKRACVNWGIGRELYTAPFIFIGAGKCAIKRKTDGRGFTCYDRFRVAAIAYDDARRINQLRIVDSRGKVVYELGKIEQAEPVEKDVLESKKDELQRMCQEKRIDLGKWLEQCGRTLDTVTEQELSTMIHTLNKQGDGK